MSYIVISSKPFQAPWTDLLFPLMNAQFFSA